MFILNSSLLSRDRSLSRPATMRRGELLERDLLIASVSRNSSRYLAVASVAPRTPRRPHPCSTGKARGLWPPSQPSCARIEPSGCSSSSQSRGGGPRRRRRRCRRRRGRQGDPPDRESTCSGSCSARVRGGSVHCYGAKTHLVRLSLLAAVTTAHLQLLGLVDG